MSAGKSLTLFDELNRVKTGAMALPSHAAKFLDENESNIAERNNVPTLSPEGRKWATIINGEKTQIERKDADGDLVPVQVLRVAVLKFAAKRGRAYYEGVYDPKKITMPVCWSDDGIKPTAQVPDPVSKKCDGCPMSIKGSKQTDNNTATTACSQHRLVAVLPVGSLKQPDPQPLRLKIAITSDWDGQSPDLVDQGWFGFQNYTQFLAAKGVTHTGLLVTKMKFDPNTNYPKVIFGPDRWLDADELKVVTKLANSEEVAALISGSYKDVEPEKKALPAPDEDEDEPVVVKKPKAKAAPVEDDEDEAPAPKKKAKPPVDEDEDETPAPKKKAKPPVDEDEDDEPAPPPKKAKAPVEDEEEEAPAPKAKAKAAPAKAKAKAPVDEDEDEAPAPKKKGASKAVASDVPEDVAGILDNWEE